MRLLRPEQIQLMRLGLPPMPLNAMRERLAAIGIPDRNISQIAPILEREDPNGTIYTDDVLARVQADQSSRFGSWSGNEDSNDILSKITAQTTGGDDDARAVALRGTAAGKGWNQEGQQLWSDSQKDDDSFGDIFKIALPIALSVFGAPYLAAAFGGGALGMAAAGAVIGGGSALLTGGDVLKGALLGGAGGAASSFFGGAGGAAAGGADAAASMVGDVHAVAGNIDALSAGNTGASIASEIGGVPSDAGTFLRTGGDMSLAGPQPTAGTENMLGADKTISAAANMNGGGYEAAVGGAGVDAGSYGGAPVTSGPVSRGLIGSIVDWAKENPQLASAGAQSAFGMLKGAGDQKLANELLDKRVSADKDLQSQKQQNAIELEEWRRKFAQSGSYFDALVPFKRGGTTLRRPDGSNVYAPGGGLIAGQMAP